MRLGLRVDISCWQAHGPGSSWTLGSQDREAPPTWGPCVQAPRWTLTPMIILSMRWLGLGAAPRSPTTCAREEMEWRAKGTLHFCVWSVRAGNTHALRQSGAAEGDAAASRLRPLLQFLGKHITRQQQGAGLPQLRLTAPLSDRARPVPQLLFAAGTDLACRWWPELDTGHGECKALLTPQGHRAAGLETSRLPQVGTPQRAAANSPGRHPC